MTTGDVGPPEVVAAADGGRRRDDNVRSIEKAIAILDCFSTLDRQLSVATIAKQIGIPRGTAHRIIATLRDHGLLERDRERDHYRLGMKLFEYGTTVLGTMELQREAKSFVEALTKVSGISVHLCVFDGIRSTVVNRTECDGNRANTTVVIEAAPAHCTSTGKAILAFQSPAIIASARPGAHAVYAAHHFGQRCASEGTCAGQGRRGYAVDNEELSIGIRCVGAPPSAMCPAACSLRSVSGPACKVPDARIAELAELVIHYADAISAQLGYRETAVQRD
ncbi:MAG: IclR family transcriptional regulator [Betaproteobacteria bacterium]|nr:IclR family transcriptional regulator [Betaproteobacteria bacterium]